MTLWVEGHVTLWVEVHVVGNADLEGRSGDLDDIILLLSTGIKLSLDLLTRQLKYDVHYIENASSPFVFLSLLPLALEQ